jgi:hypothetical protein
MMSDEREKQKSKLKGQKAKPASQSKAGKTPDAPRVTPTE